MKKKRFFLLIPLFVFCVGFFTKPLWAPRCVGFLVRSTLSSQAGVGFTYAKCHKEGGFWVFDEATFAQNQHPWATAKHLRVKMDWNLFDRSVQLQLFLHSFVVELPEDRSAIRRRIEEWIEAPSSSFQTTVDLTISNGKILYSHKDVPYELNYQFHGSLGSVLEGEWTSCLRSQEGAIGESLCEIRQNAERRWIDLHMSEIPLCGLFPLLELVHPVNEAWELTEGDLTGYLHILFPTEGTKVMDGNLVARRVNGEHLSSNIHGFIDEVELKIFPKENPTALVSISRPAIFFDGQNQFIINEGEARMDLEEGMDLDLEGAVVVGGESIPYHLEGDTTMGVENRATLSLNLGEEIPMRWSIDFLSSEDKKTITLKTTNLSLPSFYSFFSLFEQWIPIDQTTHFEKGIIDTTLVAELENGRVERFSIPSFSGKGIQLRRNQQALTIDQIYAGGVFDQNGEKLSEGLSGSCRFFGVQWSDKEQLSSLLNLEGAFHVERGILQNSSLLFSMQDCCGQIDWISPLPHEVVRLNLEGPLAPWVNRIPALEGGELFPSNNAVFTGFLSPTHNGFALDGDLALEEEKKISFSCELDFVHEPTPFSLLGFHPVFLNRQYSFPFGFLFPPVEEEKLYPAPRGWFETAEFDFATFQSLVPEGMNVFGKGSLKGKWDSENIHVSVFGEEFRIDSDSFGCSIPKLDGEEGEWTFSFLEKSWQGVWALEHVDYDEKNSGLRFNESKGILKLTPGFLSVKELETHCGGLSLTGEIECQNRGMADAEWTIHAETCEGSIEDCKGLAKEFSLFPNYRDFQAEGAVHLWGKGFTLGLCSTNEGWKPSVHLEGMIDHGVVRNEEHPFRFCDVEAYFRYDSTEETVNIPEMSGILWSEKKEFPLNWTVQGSGNGFLGTGKEAFGFSFAILEAQNEFLGGAGQLQKKGEKGWELGFDLSKTHLGPFSPSVCRAFLGENGWEDVTFSIDFSFPEALDELKNLTVIQNISSFQFLEGAIKKDAFKGKASFSLSGSLLDEKWLFSLLTKDLSWKGKQIEPLTLRGKKEGKAWGIEQISWRDLSLSADFIKEGKRWSIPFLGVEWDELALVGMEGKQDNDDGKWIFNIPFFDVQLDALSKKGWVSDPSLSGTIQGRGMGTIVSLDHPPFVHFTTTLELKADEITLEEGEWEGAADSIVKIDSAEGVSIEKGIGRLTHRETQQPYPLSLESGSWSFHDYSWTWKGFAFHVPFSSLSPLLDAAAKKVVIPNLEEIKETAMKVKPQGKWEGSIDGQQKEGETLFQVHMNPSSYILGGAEVPCRTLEIEKGPRHWKFFAQIAQQQKLFWLSGMIPSEETLTRGYVLVSDRDPREKPLEDISPLAIFWKQEEEGITVERIHGTFSGLDCVLERADSFCSDQQEVYKGTIAMQMDRLSPLLPPALSKKIREWQMGEGYRLEGTWYLPRQHDEFSLPQFSGILIGENFAFSDYLIDAMQAKVTFTGKDLLIQDLTISDLALEGKIPQVNIDLRTNEDWWATIPLIEFNSLRPSLLFQRSTHQRGQKDPFLVQKVHVENLTGNLSEGRWDGGGNLSFIHDAPLLRDHPLLAIPSEIILRLGLDPTLFTPVRGKILYRFQGDRIVFHKFKDMYSEGKGSRFYLAKGKEESWMDFDGNLHLMIGMKHYNLFFKLAELFNVQVQGTLAEPTYRLSRQKAV